MGGTGSGRWQYHTKSTLVEDCLTLDTAILRREQLLGWRSSRGTSEWRDDSAVTLGSVAWSLEPVSSNQMLLRLSYVAGSEWCPEFVTDVVSLIAIRPMYGGRRWFFECPTCGRHVCKLFMPVSTTRFRCRRCHRLTYRSCQESGTLFGYFHRLQRYGLLPIPI
jgi:hypothetical protein